MIKKLVHSFTTLLCLTLLVATTFSKTYPTEPILPVEYIDEEERN